jgi:hypothetical protein
VWARDLAKEKAQDRTTGAEIGSKSFAVSDDRRMTDREFFEGQRKTPPLTGKHGGVPGPAR